ARRVDPAVVLDGRFAGELETPIVRRAAPDVGHMMARLNHQTSLRAQDLADADDAGDLATDLMSAIGRFWTSYVWRQGVREGELGFLIAMMAGLDAVLSGLRARELLKARAVASATAPAQPARIGRTG
ncbi:MAG TPA: glycosyltransferase family 2 protein, partial [Phenylobacterium sp.]|nr:glycosyltransferase family 2 protein [Phenylobacterium sp.]